MAPSKVFLIGGLLFTALAIGTPSEEASKEQLGDVQRRLETLRDTLNQSEAAQHDATDDLQISERAISHAKRELKELAQKEADNRHNLEQLKQKVQETTQTLQQQQALLSQLFYQQYLYGEQSYMQMVLQNERSREITHDVYYFTYIAKARATLIQDALLSLQQLATLKNATSTALDTATRLKEARLVNLKVLNSEKRAKAQVLKQLAHTINAQRHEIKKLSRDEKRLSRLLQGLASLQVQRSTVLANNIQLPNALEGSFASLKGRLRLPVRGEVLNRYGVNRADTGLVWKGLFIHANEGAEVHAVANGAVIFADWLRGFGNLIILDHGSGYISLYANNQSLLKRVGDTVRGGDYIATVGNSGGNESSGLYYELRLNSRPFDPMTWSNLN